MYYILADQDLDDTESIAQISDGPDLDEADWYAGERFTMPIPRPLRFTLDPTAEGELPFFWDWTIPLMHEELIAGLMQAGVDNLDVYDAVILDEESGTEWTDFKAVNVVGKVAAANLGLSRYFSRQPTPLIAVQFDSLAIDENKTDGLLMFRLAECVSAIVVHEKVRDTLKARDILVGFIEPKDFVS